MRSFSEGGAWRETGGGAGGARVAAVYSGLRRTAVAGGRAPGRVAAPIVVMRHAREGAGMWRKHTMAVGVGLAVLILARASWAGALGIPLDGFLTTFQT